MWQPFSNLIHIKDCQLLSLIRLSLIRRPYLIIWWASVSWLWPSLYSDKSTQSTSYSQSDRINGLFFQVTHKTVLFGREREALSLLGLSPSLLPRPFSLLSFPESTSDLSSLSFSISLVTFLLIHLTLSTLSNFPARRGYFLNGDPLKTPILLASHLLVVCLLRKLSGVSNEVTDGIPLTKTWPTTLHFTIHKFRNIQMMNSKGLYKKLTQGRFQSPRLYNYNVT